MSEFCLFSFFFGWTLSPYLLACYVAHYHSHKQHWTCCKSPKVQVGHGVEGVQAPDMEKDGLNTVNGVQLHVWIIKIWNHWSLIVDRRYKLTQNEQRSQALTCSHHCERGQRWTIPPYGWYCSQWCCLSHTELSSYRVHPSSRRWVGKGWNQQPTTWRLRNPQMFQKKHPGDGPSTQCIHYKTGLLKICSNWMLRICTICSGVAVLSVLCLQHSYQPICCWKKDSQNECSQQRTANHTHDSERALKGNASSKLRIQENKLTTQQHLNLCDRRTHTTAK